MAAVGTARLPRPRPGTAATVGLRLLSRQSESLLILQLTSISRDHSTIRRLVDADGSSYSSAPPSFI